MADQLLSSCGLLNCTRSRTVSLQIRHQQAYQALGVAGGCSLTLHLPRSPTVGILTTALPTLQELRSRCWLWGCIAGAQTVQIAQLTALDQLQPFPEQKTKQHIHQRH
jgi:hypothetical protein